MFEFLWSGYTTKFAFNAREFGPEKPEIILTPQMTTCILLLL